MDHTARLKVVEPFFADPSKLQEFASTYQPHQWAFTVRMLYDLVHTARTMQAHLELLRRKGVTLPCISCRPTALNRIEKLWYLIKHKWLDFKVRNAETLEKKCLSHKNLFMIIARLPV